MSKVNKNQEQEGVESKLNKDDKLKAEDVKDDFEDLNFEEVQKIKQELQEQKDMFLRMAAEYENYRKRSERDKVNIYDSATADAIEVILPVVDSLSRASFIKSGTAQEYKKGLELVNQQLLTALSKLRVESFGKAGDKFNPNIHNAISHVDDKSLQESCVAEVFQQGYKVGDKVIRCAVVKIAN
ncbi:MAG: nucleotide exchange factor GrpE [Oscillospiraceae bacterium]|nr:nucleotide exchange factor GrpE [Oscillospiraceae bacterium]